MALTYTAIATVTVGSGGADTIEFTSIPNTYTDLCLKVSARGDGGSATMFVNFNDNASSYAYRTLWGSGGNGNFNTQSATGTTSISPGSQAGNLAWVNATASTFSNYELYIFNYTRAKNKSVSIDSVIENNASLAYAMIESALWENTSAITKIVLDPTGSGEKMIQYSTATLYGIKNTV